MAGTKEGSKKAVAKILARDPNHFKRIGAIGGRNGNTGGFATRRVCLCELLEGEHQRQQCAGKTGGLISRRVKAHAPA